MLLIEFSDVLRCGRLGLSPGAESHRFQSPRSCVTANTNKRGTYAAEPTGLKILVSVLIDQLFLLQVKSANRVLEELYFRFTYSMITVRACSVIKQGNRPGTISPNLEVSLSDI